MDKDSDTKSRPDYWDRRSGVRLVVDAKLVAGWTVADINKCLLETSLSLFSSFFFDFLIISRSAKMPKVAELAAQLRIAEVNAQNFDTKIKKK